MAINVANAVRTLLVVQEPMFANVDEIGLESISRACPQV
jgi:hypothetical protein